MKNFIFILTLLVISCSKIAKVNTARSSRSIAGLHRVDRQNTIDAKIGKSSSVSRIEKWRLQYNKNYSDPLSFVLEDRKRKIYNWMTECDAQSGYEGQISDNRIHCEQGDVVLWAGISCLAAHLVGDTFIINKRCNDVANAQDISSGRWWRGESKINNQPVNAFSRDMSLGVIAYMIGEGVISNNQQKKNIVKQKLKKWWEYIETQGGGNMMCDNATDNRCKLFGNPANLLYQIGQHVGAIDSTNKNYDIVKKNENQPSAYWWRQETRITPVDFNLHLKAQGLLDLFILGSISNNNFKKTAKVIFNKDKANPLYEFLYTGTTAKLIDDVLMKCDATSPSDRANTLSFGGSANWAWQSNSRGRQWLRANGHDCIALINLMIADLEQKIVHPAKINSQTVNECQGKRSYLGEYQNKDVCKKINYFSTSDYGCQNDGGVVWRKNNKKYCLTTKITYWKAREIKRTCPSLTVPVNEKYNNLDVCRPEIDLTISLPNCNKESLNSSEPKNQGKPTHCYKNKGSYYLKKKIGLTCPITNPDFQGEYIWGAWPVCKSYSKIEKKDCNGTYDIQRADHCIKQKPGWFSKKKYKVNCPWYMIDTNVEKDDKPLCKNVISFDISSSKCNKRGGTVYQNYCIWDESYYFKARDID